MGLSLGLGILFSAMTAKYRDLRFLLAFGVQLLMFTTTAVYPLSGMASARYRLLVLANPMTAVIENSLRLRDDVIGADPLTAGGRRDAVLANAPAAEHGFFGVPKVIE